MDLSVSTGSHSFTGKLYSYGEFHRKYLQEILEKVYFAGRFTRPINRSHSFIGNLYFAGSFNQGSFAGNLIGSFIRNFRTAGFF